MNPGMGAETTNTSRTRVSPVADADGQRLMFCRHGVDGYGLRPQQPSEHEQQDKQERRPECQTATQRCVHGLIPAS